MTIAAIGVGAAGYIYLQGEYPHAPRRPLGLPGVRARLSGRQQWQRQGLREGRLGRCYICGEKLRWIISWRGQVRFHCWRSLDYLMPDRNQQRTSPACLGTGRGAAYL
jgi:hypothetical protein